VLTEKMTLLLMDQPVLNQLETYDICLSKLTIFAILSSWM